MRGLAEGKECAERLNRSRCGQPDIRARHKCTMQKDKIAPATIPKNWRSAQGTHAGPVVPHEFLFQMQ